MSRKELSIILTVLIVIISFASCMQSVIWFGKITNSEPTYENRENEYNDSVYYPQDY